MFAPSRAIAIQPGRRFAGPLSALGVPLAVALVMALAGCGESVGECVQVYEFEGEVRKANYTRAECEEECSIIGRTLQCFFAPARAMPTAVAEREPVANGRRT